MKENKYLIDLLLETKDKFGMKNALWLFSEYLPKGLPPRAYDSYQTVRDYLKREIDGFYHLREENRRSKQIEEKLKKYI